jgi:hypothetical protein
MIGRSCRTAGAGAHSRRWIKAFAPIHLTAIKKWRRKWRENRDAVVGESWAAQMDAEGGFQSAQMAVAKIRPRDIDELTLKACLSGVYDKVQLAYGSKAAIGYSVALDLVSRRTAAA